MYSGVTRAHARPKRRNLPPGLRVVRPVGLRHRGLLSPGERARGRPSPWDRANHGRSRLRTRVGMLRLVVTRQERLLRSFAAGDDRGVSLGYRGGHRRAAGRGGGTLLSASLARGLNAELLLLATSRCANPKKKTLIFNSTKELLGRYSTPPPPPPLWRVACAALNVNCFCFNVSLQLSSSNNK
jgi:hypothetical protein